MLRLAELLLDASMILITVAMVSTIAMLATQHGRLRSVAHEAAPAKELATVGGAPSSSSIQRDPLHDPVASPAQPHGVAWYNSRLIQLALVCLTVSLGARATVTGHAPFANQHEFAVAFAWGILCTYAYFEWRYQVRALGLLVLPVSLAMMARLRFSKLWSFVLAR